VPIPLKKYTRRVLASGTKVCNLLGNLTFAGPLRANCGLAKGKKIHVGLFVWVEPNVFEEGSH